MLTCFRLQLLGRVPVMLLFIRYSWFSCSTATTNTIVSTGLPNSGADLSLNLTDNARSSSNALHEEEKVEQKERLWLSRPRHTLDWKVFDT